MKKIIKATAFSLLLATSFTACNKDKADEIVPASAGTPVALTTNANTYVLTAANANNKVFALSWTDPKYAQSSSLYKYVVEIDSSTRGFSKGISRTIIGKRVDSLTASELNSILLGFGFTYNVSYSVDVRVTSSYGNNNEQYKSNIVKLSVTPYKVPPAVAFPASNKLFMVGSATQGGWNNPVPTPNQEFVKINDDAFAGVVNLNGGSEFLLLPVNGDWGAKYGNTCGGNSCNSGAGATFKAQGDNFAGPATSGWYKMIFDFQTGKYTATSVAIPTSTATPTNLYIVGDATQGGWNNPVPATTQQFQQPTPGIFTLTVNLTAGKSYLFLPVNGSWNNKFGGGDDTFGSLQADNAVPGSNTPSPAVTGNYKITVDFLHKIYYLQKQ
jgi:starch-binding outer membrane protein SusE/F